MSKEITTASPHEFTAHVSALQAEAERLCRQCPDSDLDQWMKAAKARGMTWVDGLEWVIRSLG